MINLTGVESYNEYLRIFTESPYLTSAEKQLFYGVNRERFLFGVATTKERVVVEEEVG